MPLGDSGINPGLAASDPARELQNAVRRGESFSGRERHVVLQNRAGRLVEVSGITGLDLPDDGRAACFTDWDADGDLDLWLSNRSAPQVRFFRNDHPDSAPGLTLKLVGKSAHRDAIGARAVLQIKGQPAQTRTVTAGSGFLAQSGKALHFGLGEGAEIESLTVHWPGGEPQTLTGLKPGAWTLTQGEALLAAEPRTGASGESTPAPAPAARSFLAARLPVATLFERPADRAGKHYLLKQNDSPLFQIAHDHSFDINGRIPPAPLTFLIDAQDRLCAIYRGAIDPAALARDVANLSLEGAALRTAALPFPGRWASDYVPEARPLSFAEDLLDAGLLDAAGRYIEHHRSTLQRDPLFRQLLGRLDALRE